MKNDGDNLRRVAFAQPPLAGSHEEALRRQIAQLLEMLDRITEEATAIAETLDKDRFANGALRQHRET